MVKRNILFMGWPMLMKVKHDGEMLMYWVIDMCIIEYTEYKRIQYINTWVQHWKRGQYRHFRCLQKQGNHSLQTICPRLKKKSNPSRVLSKTEFFLGLSTLYHDVVDIAKQWFIWCLMQKKFCLFLQILN